MKNWIGSVMATTSTSNGSPAPHDTVISSTLNTIAMSHTVDVVDVNPRGEEEGGGGGEEAGVGSLEPEEASASFEGGGDATETIARGIATVLGPVVRKFETRVDEVLKSQSTLQTSIDRLTRELDKLLEDTPLPLGAQHAAKLSGIRKRVGSLAETLQIIQSRINKMDRLLSKESLVGSQH